MATVTSIAHTYMVALADALTARPGLDGVQVATGWLGGDSARESIQFTAVRGTQQWGMLSNRRRNEEFVIEATIWAVEPGKGEDVIRTVRARALALLAEIEDELRVDPTVGNVAQVSQVTFYNLDQGATTAGRGCQIEFEITVNKDLRSS